MGVTQLRSKLSGAVAGRLVLAALVLAATSCATVGSDIDGEQPNEEAADAQDVGDVRWPLEELDALGDPGGDRVNVGSTVVPLPPEWSMARVGGGVGISEAVLTADDGRSVLVVVWALRHPAMVERRGITGYILGEVLDVLGVPPGDFYQELPDNSWYLGAPSNAPDEGVRVRIQT